MIHKLYRLCNPLENNLAPEPVGIHRESDLDSKTPYEFLRKKP